MADDLIVMRLRSGLDNADKGADGVRELGGVVLTMLEAADRIEALEREREAHLATLEHMGNAVKRMQDAEAALATMTQERDGARQANREMVMEALAAYGQAQDAYEAQVKAEAALATARADALREAEKAILPDGDIAWRGSWYEPALRAAQSRVRALIDGGRT